MCIFAAMNENILPIHFAPLQGYTDAVYRRAHARIFGGIETYYSPFVRMEHGEIRRKDARDIEPDNNPDLHLIPQLIAPDADKLERRVFPRIAAYAETGWSRKEDKNYPDFLRRLKRYVEILDARGINYGETR